MLTRLVIALALSVSLLAGGARPQMDVLAQVALLPLTQQDSSNAQGLSDDELTTALLIELTRTAEFQLVEFSRLHESFEDRLVDDAVFELLITDDLTQTLQVLDAFSTEVGRHTLYGQTARQLGVQYLIETACQARRDRVEVSYKLIDTQANRIVFARTLAGDHTGIVRETAKRMVRDLWRVRHSPPPACGAEPGAR
ncbi:MAG: hypothetical protein MUC88_18745 [Planctomycetes bacterium]|jgi:TolB-like protein|nr:hypothetical protein [Planctomycetota bacterium]